MTAKQILDLLDAGTSPVDIVRLTDLSRTYVYAVLRKHRPARARAPRTRTSERVPMIIGLRSRGRGVGRIAELCECSQAYVYRVLAEAEK